MLVYARMNRAALVLALLTASSGVASAGWYAGLGIGTGPEIGSDVGDFEDGGRSGKALVGSRWGNFAVEGALAGYDVIGPSNNVYDTWHASIAGKLNLPIGDGFEGFGRVGIQRTWLSPESSDYDVSGTGYLVGAGIEYRLNLAATAASIWIDYQYSSADLEGMRDNFEYSARMWTLGATIGF
jgi:hypothetical protein